MQRALGSTGAGGFLNDATAPPNQLPTDLLVSMKLWERPYVSGVGGSSDDFVEMVDLTRHGGLPSRV